MKRKIYHQKLFEYEPNARLTMLELPIWLENALSKAHIRTLADLGRTLSRAIARAESEEILPEDFNVKDVGEAGLTKLLDVLAQSGWSAEMLALAYRNSQR